MSFARRHMSCVIALWIACQIAGIAAAPVAFCCRGVPTIEDDKCCPGLLPGQVCPMHHTKEGERTCKMRNACARSDAALIALATGVGLLPQATALVSVFDPGTLVKDASASALRRAHLPESPPPRA